MKSPASGKSVEQEKGARKMEGKAKIKEELMCIKRRQSNNSRWLFCFFFFFLLLYEYIMYVCMAGGKSANKRVLRRALNKDVKNVRHC